MRKLKFVKADPIGKVYKESDELITTEPGLSSCTEVFILNIGNNEFSIKLAIKNYWLLYGKEDLVIHVKASTDKRIIQELMRYPVKLGLIGEVK